MAAAENAQIKEIDLINSSEVTNRVYTISSAGGYKFTCSNQQTTNRIVVDGTLVAMGLGLVPELVAALTAFAVILPLIVVL